MPFFFSPMKHRSLLFNLLNPITLPNMAFFLCNLRMMNTLIIKSILLFKDHPFSEHFYFLLLPDSTFVSLMILHLITDSSTAKQFAPLFIWKFPFTLKRKMRFFKKEDLTLRLQWLIPDFKITAVVKLKFFSNSILFFFLFQVDLIPSWCVILTDLL